MIPAIYDLLHSIGFYHPLHPALTHIPMGMVMGGVLFYFTSLLFHNDSLSTSSQHCFILALIFIIPTMIAGYMDWVVLLSSKSSIYINIKIGLAFTLLVLLAVAVKIGNHPDSNPKLRAAVCILCLLAATGLGFCGGQLIYG